MEETTHIVVNELDDIPPLVHFDIPRSLHSRCMRVHRWDEGFAHRAVAAYRQFMGLKIRLKDWDATKLATPPLIEHVWQQHILDVNHYATACGEHRIHHNPDDGFGTETYERRVSATQLALDCPDLRQHDKEMWSFSSSQQPDRGEEEEQEPSSSSKKKRARRSSSSSNRGEPPSRRTDAITFFVRWTRNNNHLQHNDLYFKIGPDTKMARVFERFNMHWSQNGAVDDDDSEEEFSFFFGGRLLRPHDTANTIGLVSDDMVCATRCNAVEDAD